MTLVEKLSADFQKLAEKGNLGHGYVLFGHDSAREKLAIAKDLAKFFETSATKPSKGVLLDALFLDAQAEDKGIDIVRGASQFLWQRPVVSFRRTLVIVNADRLTLPAQNAILKIAEEPPPSALIILIVKDPDILLPAVVSRFQKIFVAKDPKAKEIDSELAKKFIKSSEATRKELLKNLMEEIKEVENDIKLEEFVTGLIVELRKDKIKNYVILKRLLSRWSLIRQFNVNKKLQLEAALVNL